MPLPYLSARANITISLSYIMFNIIVYYSTRLLNKTKIIFFMLYGKRNPKKTDILIYFLKPGVSSPPLGSFVKISFKEEGNDEDFVKTCLRTLGYR